MSESEYYSGQGDDGRTRLLGPGRVPKYDLRPEAYGTVDEAQAAMGLARAAGCTARTAEILLAAQRDLYSLMAELAAAGGEHGAFAARVGAEDVTRLEGWVAELESGMDPPVAFVVPGDSAAGAALHVARTVVRRAERAAVRLADEGLLVNWDVVRYLNRLSSLLYAMALFEDRAARGEVTPAKQD